MGVPAFYRWLIEKYPDVRVKVKENKETIITSDPNLNQNPNPNGIEFDHLYLDMNGIIHPCFHPDSLVFQPTTFEEVFENVYAYIDRLFSVIKPRKLLYLAIDGVAPRAKMNQQRSRRFKTARDNEVVDKQEKELREKYERRGKKLLPVLESQVSDSNVITPGTEFMFELSNALKSYIVKRLESDPGWKDIKVVLSDATVPGEGEHKIMSFIRTWRSIPGYDPNTRHCLYGLDADLIMLALATHEIHFSILREDLTSMRDDKPNSESAIQSTIQRAVNLVHSVDKSTEQDKKPFNIRDKSPSTLILPQHYEFLHVWILREYLELDMQIIDPPEKFVFDFERTIDDFIFMCLFVGNDFLPHMPTLEISENGIDLLMFVYKNEFKNLGGYLVDMQRVNEPHVSFIKLKRVEKFILSVGSYEEKVFSKRMELKEKMLGRIARDWAESRKGKGEVDEESSDVCITDAMCPKVSKYAEEHEAKDSQTNSISVIKEMIENTKELKEELKKNIRENSDIFSDGVVLSDKVKLSSVGWKQRYYKVKFAVEDPMETETLRKEIVQKYTEGLCWVLMYYFSGISSWNWYYSYYYCLFASELKGLAQVKVKFHKGSPFLPFDQLMAVLPPKSAHALPEAYRDLMTSDDSNIVEFYPKNFEVDMDGKRFLWQGICKLPFIDQEKLLKATSQLETKIDMSEAVRNVESTDHLFWRGSNRCSNVIWDYIVPHTEKADEIQIAMREEPIMCCNFKLPVLTFQPPRLLEGVQLPEKTVFEKDIMERPLWHECKGKPYATRRPISRSETRVPIQQTHRKAATEEPVIHKHAGAGWSGAGRGRGRGNGTNFNSSGSYNNNIPRNQQTSATSRGWFNQHPAAASISSSSPTTVNRGMESLRLSPQYSQNGSFWNARNAPSSYHSPSRRPVSYAAVANHQCSTWRPVSTANPRSPSLGTGSSSTFTPAGRGRGQGRNQGYYRHNTDNERSRDPNRW